MSTLDLPDSNQLAGIASANQLRLIVLFGSAARGVMHGESDIDLGVLVEKKLTTSRRIALWSQLSRLFSQDVDLSVLNHIDPAVAFQIASEGVVLFEDEPDTWENWKSYAIRQYWDTEKFRTDLKKYVAERAEEMRYALSE
jgi:predicted nucleotidyltransferase